MSDLVPSSEWMEGYRAGLEEGERVAAERTVREVREAVGLIARLAKEAPAEPGYWTGYANAMDQACSIIESDVTALLAIERGMHNETETGT